MDEVLELLEEIYGVHDAPYYYQVVKGGYDYYINIGYLPDIALQQIREDLTEDET